jgi:hypothetical protein
MRSSLARSHSQACELASPSVGTISSVLASPGADISFNHAISSNIHPIQSRIRKEPITESFPIAPIVQIRGIISHRQATGRRQPEASHRSPPSPPLSHVDRSCGLAHAHSGGYEPTSYESALCCTGARWRCTVSISAVQPFEVRCRIADGLIELDVSRGVKGRQVCCLISEIRFLINTWVFERSRSS